MKHIVVGPMGFEGHHVKDTRAPLSPETVNINTLAHTFSCGTSVQFFGATKGAVPPQAPQGRLKKTKHGVDAGTLKSTKTNPSP